MLRIAALTVLALLPTTPTSAPEPAVGPSALATSATPLVRVGDVLEVRDASGATVGYGFAANAGHYWRLPPSPQRPPAPTRRFDMSVLYSNWTLAQFVSLVRNTWQTDDRWVEGRIVEYTSYESIPSGELELFYPGSSVARQVDIGTVGAYSAGGPGVGVGHRYSSGTQYEEYWVLSTSYDATAANSFEDGAIPSSLTSWQSGHTALKVAVVESGVCP